MIYFAWQPAPTIVGLSNRVIIQKVHCLTDFKITAYLFDANNIVLIVIRGVDYTSDIVFQFEI
jgi:hypothetical protein